LNPPNLIRGSRSKQSIDEILQQCLASDIWVFAYGSLIWNPIFKYSDRCVGIVYGWHRHFCLWTPLGRGTPENPGLVLGLDRGGSCRGIIYRVAANDVATELLLLWRREMVARTYIPRWVKVVSGEQVVKAIAFVINSHHSLYAPKLSLDDTAYAISKAHGSLGSCADYLLQTVEGLAEFGIVDRNLIQIRDRVLSLLNSNLEI
jgi:glutathione-specific gamma-glutamylcyclotransferase